MTVSLDSTAQALKIWVHVGGILDYAFRKISLVEQAPNLKQALPTNQFHAVRSDFLRSVCFYYCFEICLSLYL